MMRTAFIMISIAVHTLHVPSLATADAARRLAEVLGVPAPSHGPSVVAESGRLRPSGAAS